MKIIKIKNGKILKEDLLKILEALKAGEVIMHATETCYGLAVDVFQQKALNRLYALKEMSFSKPVSIMVSDLKMAQKNAEFNHVAIKLAQKFWPGPLTLVLPRKETLPEFLNPGHSTVGIRCPNHDVSRSLIENFGGPLTTTSANISGLKQVYCVADYLQQLKQLKIEPAIILDQGIIAENEPSTLVGFEIDSKNNKVNYKIIREGSLINEIREYLNLLQ